jgi:hypothetical protein
MPIIDTDDLPPPRLDGYDAASPVGRFAIVLIVCSLPLGATLAGGAQDGNAAPRNLQVLTPDVDLPLVMQEFNDALGVACTHCHVDGDFASDDNPKMAVARTMLRMQQRVAARFPDSGNDFQNSRYLPFPQGKQYVTCATCHQGSVTPVSAVPDPEGPPRAPEPGSPAGPPGGARAGGAGRAAAPGGQAGAPGGRAGAPGGRAGLPGAAGGGAAAAAPLLPGRGRQQHMNMVELPSDADTFLVMPGFRASLGVECNFCHVFGDTHERGHADERHVDGNPKKLIARNMIAMLKQINAALYPDANVDIVFAAASVLPEGTKAVTCYTCHRGNHLPPVQPAATR